MLPTFRSAAVMWLQREDIETIHGCASFRREMNSSEILTAAQAEPASGNSSKPKPATYMHFYNAETGREWLPEFGSVS